MSLTNSVIFHLVFLCFFYERPTFMFSDTEKLRFNEFEETKYFGFFIMGVLSMQGAFYYKISYVYRGTKNYVLYCWNFIIEKVVIPRFQCS